MQLTPSWLLPLLLTAATFSKYDSFRSHRPSIAKRHNGKDCYCHSEQQPEQSPVVTSVYEHDRHFSGRSLAKLLAATAFSLGPAGTAAAARIQRIDEEMGGGNVAELELPLDSFEDVFTVNYTVNGVVFRAIVDTGSPFIIIPSVCTRTWGGCSATGHFNLERCNLEPTVGTCCHTAL